MQMQQLRYFLEIAKTKNISAAAKNLYLSQPSLSQQIMKLEEELGIPLLVRHAKSVTLTEAGEQFALHAQRIIGSVDQLSDLMQKARDLNTGTLKLGFLWIAGYIDLFDLLTEYKNLYPGVSCSIRVEGSETLLRQLLERSLHGAFIISTEEMLRREKDLFFYKVQDDNYVAVVSKANPLSRKKLLSIKDFDGENIIMPSKYSTLRRQIKHEFERYGVVPEIVSESSQSDLVIQLASHNLGIGFSSRSIAESLCTDAVCSVPLDIDFTRTIYYITLRELLDYPTVRSFTQFIGRKCVG